MTKTNKSEKEGDCEQINSIDSFVGRDDDPKTHKGGLSPPPYSE